MQNMWSFYTILSNTILNIWLNTNSIQTCIIKMEISITLIFMDKMNVHNKLQRKQYVAALRIYSNQSIV